MGPDPTHAFYSAQRVLDLDGDGGRFRHGGTVESFQNQYCFEKQSPRGFIQSFPGRTGTWTLPDPVRVSAQGCS